MTDALHDLQQLQVPPEREVRRQEAARDVAAMLLKIQYEEGLLELEDAVRGAMVGIGEVLAPLEGENAYFAELCGYFGDLAKLRDRPSTSRGLQ